MLCVRDSQRKKTIEFNQGRQRIIAFTNAIHSVANNIYSMRARGQFDCKFLGHMPCGTMDCTGDGGPLWSDRSAALANALLRQLMQIDLQVGIACNPQPLHG